LTESRVEIERFRSDGTTPAAFEAVRGILDAPVEPLSRGIECLVAHRSGRPVARLSMQARDDLVSAPGSSGLVGHYEALDRDAGVALLEAACRELGAAGAVRVLGPINGTTWARYRLALPAQSGDLTFDPPYFASEPRNPFDYPGHFGAAGFHVVAHYESRMDDLSTDALDAGDVAARVLGAGFSVRPIDLDAFGAELDVLFELSLEAFARNPYYSPIEAREFHAMYEPLRRYMDGEFVQVVLDPERRPCGYLFAFADPVAAGVGHARLIAKTVAVAPRVRGLGLANFMLDRVRSSARRRGFRDVVHALMHVANASASMSRRYDSRIFRRYALWEWIA
jgi:GNAT superfamily N-acetyltransferase